MLNKIFYSCLNDHTSWIKRIYCFVVSTSLIDLLIPFITKLSNFHSWSPTFWFKHKRKRNEIKRSPSLIDTYRLSYRFRFCLLPRGGRNRNLKRVEQTIPIAAEILATSVGSAHVGTLDMNNFHFHFHNSVKLNLITPSLFFFFPPLSEVVHDITISPKGEIVRGIHIWSVEGLKVDYCEWRKILRNGNEKVKFSRIRWNWLIFEIWQ